MNDIQIVNSTISGNTAYSDGGGIFNNDAMLVQNSTLTGNRSLGGWGGAIINDGGALKIRQSQLSANRATEGAGITNRAGPNAPSIDLIDVTISDNGGAIEGGGIYNQHGSLVARNSTFSGNQAMLGGGGLTNSASVTLTNVTFSGNSSLQGGGIVNVGQISLVHVTLADNWGGGFIHSSGNSNATFTLVDTIVANSLGGGVNCFLDPGSKVPITSNGFNLSSDNSCTPYFDLFTDWNNANANLGKLRNNGGPTWTHEVFPISNAIDHGGCLDGVTTDQRGTPRPLGEGCDIGAVEYEPFTDDPLIAGVTVVKAVHVTELRARIEQLRTRYGVAAFNWTDPSLTGGTSAVRAQHIVDLRTALAQAYAAAIMTPPTYTDPALAAGTPTKAVHINELRAAIITLDLQ